MRVTVFIKAFVLPLSNLLVFQTYLESFIKHGSLGSSLGDQLGFDVGSNSSITVVDLEGVGELLYLCYVLSRSAYLHIIDGKAETQK